MCKNCNTSVYQEGPCPACQAEIDAENGHYQGWARTRGQFLFEKDGLRSSAQWMALPAKARAEWERLSFSAVENHELPSHIDRRSPGQIIYERFTPVDATCWADLPQSEHETWQLSAATIFAEFTPTVQDPRSKAVLAAECKSPGQQEFERWHAEHKSHPLWEKLPWEAITARDKRVWRDLAERRASKLTVCGVDMASSPDRTVIMQHIGNGEHTSFTFTFGEGPLLTQTLDSIAESEWKDHGKPTGAFRQEDAKGYVPPVAKVVPRIRESVGAAHAMRAAMDSTLQHGGPWVRARGMKAVGE